MRVGLSTCMIQGGKTGVAQYVLSLVRALLSRADCPELMIFTLENDAALFHAAQVRAQLHLVPERFRPALRNILWHQIELPRLARQYRLDVLHVPSYRRLLWPKPCALVATIHDLAPFHLAGKYDPARMFYGRVVARWLAQRQDQIIAVSQNTASDISRFFGICPSRVNVVLNGLDHERFHPADPEAARAQVAAQRKINRPFFLYISRLEHPGKNHVRLIEAFSVFKSSAGSDWQLVLGGSDWHGAPAIYAAARDSAARQDIRFLGFVPEVELATLYRAAGAAVYPSLYEGFGFPPLEAMACGCPVLSSTRGALAEVVADAAATIDPEDVRSIAAGLTRMAQDLEWRENLRQAGLRNAARFDWQANAEQVLHCYNRAATQLDPHTRPHRRPGANRRFQEPLNRW